VQWIGPKGDPRFSERGCDGTESSDTATRAASSEQHWGDHRGGYPGGTLSYGGLSPVIEGSQVLVRRWDGTDDETGYTVDVVAERCSQVGTRAKRVELLQMWRLL